MPPDLRLLLLAVWLVLGVGAGLGAPARAATYEEGLRALDAGEPQRALAIWTALAGQGDVAAVYGLGRLYEVGGPGFTPDKARAAGYYREAAAAGLVAAQNNLALLYAKGDGVPRDSAMAARLWEQAAVRGHPTAQYNLGLLTLRGEGVAQDEVQGAVWVRKAADAGVPAAQFVMGDLRRYGMGLVQDPAAALGWYRRAAEAGYEPARAEVLRLEASGVVARVEAPAATQGEPAAPESLATESLATEPLATEPLVTDPLAGDPVAGDPVAGEPARAVAALPDLAGEAAAAHGPPSLPPALAVPRARTSAGPKASPAAADPRPRPSPPKPTELARAAPAPPEAPASAPASAPVATPASGSALPLEALPSAAAGAPPDAGGGSGRFGLWLGSAGDEQAAGRLGRSISGRHDGALGALPVTVRRVEVAGLGTLYRVFAGAWPERAAAEQACGRLRAADPVAFCSAAAY